MRLHELARARALHVALGGGATSTLNRDVHGQSLSSCLLEPELPERQEPR
jgi:hypothetical protein